MSPESVSSQKSDTEFERLLGLMADLAEQGYCKRRAAELGLSETDADDIFSKASFKLWRAYFSPKSTRHYKHLSIKQDMELLYKILRDAGVECQRSDKSDDSVSLDAYLNDEDSFSLMDLVSQVEDLDIKLIILEAIEEVCRSARTEGPRRVAKYLLQEIERDDVEYSDEYIAVNKHRFLTAVRCALLEFHGCGSVHSSAQKT